MPGGYGGGRKAISAELERHGFRCARCLDSTPRGTLGHVATGMPDQPLPFAANIAPTSYFFRPTTM
jgi:hypothetical protein